MNEGICCKETSVVNATRPPFPTMVSLDWYDGTTSGLVQCARCLAAFKYDILEWDSNQDRRIFAFSPIGSQTFKEIVELLSFSERPTWPTWTPKFKFDSQQERERVMLQLDEHLSRAGHPESVVVSDRNLERILGLRRLSKAARHRLPAKFDGLPAEGDFNYWVEYIGLQD